MSVRDFITRIRAASSADRAEATGALARAFLYSDLDDPNREAAEAALTLMLDDPSPLVRLALADAVAAADSVPRHLILTLANDQPEIAAQIVQRSPLLLDVELVDLVGGGCARIRQAAARRAPLGRAVAAAIAEVADRDAIAAMLGNRHAEIALVTLARIVERHGEDPALRDLLLARPDLAPDLRQTLLIKLGSALSDFVARRSWLGEERASEVAREACERATIRLAASTEDRDIAGLVGHLRRTGQLTAAFLIRALCAGDVRLFEVALADLADMPVRRIVSLVHGRRGNGLRAVYARAGLPGGAYPAFAVALDVLDREPVQARDPAAFARMVADQVLARYSAASEEALDHLMALLRRIASDAAREQARLSIRSLEAA